MLPVAPGTKFYKIHDTEQSIFQPLTCIFHYTVSLTPPALADAMLELYNQNKKLHSKILHFKDTCVHLVSQTFKDQLLPHNAAQMYSVFLFSPKTCMDICAFQLRNLTLSIKFETKKPLEKNQNNTSSPYYIF